MGSSAGQHDREVKTFSFDTHSRIDRGNQVRVQVRRWGWWA